MPNRIKPLFILLLICVTISKVHAQTDAFIKQMITLQGTKLEELKGKFIKEVDNEQRRYYESSVAVVGFKTSIIESPSGFTLQAIYNDISPLPPDFEMVLYRFQKMAEILQAISISDSETDNSLKSRMLQNPEMKRVIRISQEGRNTIWFFVGLDGYVVNVEKNF